MTIYTPPPEPGRTGSGRNRPVPLVIGILLALVGLPLLLGGLGLGWAATGGRCPGRRLAPRGSGETQRGERRSAGAPRYTSERPSQSDCEGLLLVRNHLRAEGAPDCPIVIDALPQAGGWVCSHSRVVVQVSGWRQADRDRLPASKRVVVVTYGVARRLDAPDATRHRGQDRFRLQSRDMLTHALVDAHAEADVSGRVAGEVEPVRVDPAARVSVGGGQDQEDLVAVWDDHAVDVDVASCR